MSTFILTAFLISPLAGAVEGDVCNIRPDLCDGDTGTPEPEVAETVRRVPNQKTSKRVSQKKQRKLKPRKAKRHSVSQNCNISDARKKLNKNYLSECGVSIAAESEQPSTEVKRANRRPASTLSIDSYMNANANHPALAKRLQDRQQAFQDPVRPIVNTTEATSTTTAAPAPNPAEVPLVGH